MQPTDQISTENQTKLLNVNQRSLVVEIGVFLFVELHVESKVKTKHVLGKEMRQNILYIF
jgi:hypothetical protein